MSTGASVRLIPPVVYFGPFTLMWALHWWLPWRIPGGAALTMTGLVMILIGIALTFWSVVTFRRAHDRDPVGTGHGDGHHRSVPA